jgi:hypothetical protein
MTSNGEEVRLFICNCMYIKANNDCNVAKKAFGKYVYTFLETA